jgi:EAL domain-containing protein (putative c-di-GMP-specific phosphodiesterase class I)
LFIDDVRSILAETGLEAHALILELTESVLTDQTDTVLGTLRALKTVGVRLAIDDFGTGYSSLSYLQRFPIDILKIAKPFVDEVTAGANGTNGRALAQAVITLGATLAVRTIAEGIEMPQQLARLQELGCDLGQGFHFSRPLPPAELEAMLFGAAKRPSSGGQRMDASESPRLMAPGLAPAPGYRRQSPAGAGLGF